ncbi:MAG: glycosyl hydrolase, partial [Candidatus Sumerlaeota bacterium]|nr:glycosyl hydrolase [Candidatus Sumerlaeota bacterium]
MLNDRAANYCQFYVAWIMRIAGVCVAMALWVSLAAAQTGADSAADAAKNLEQGFISPPQSAGLRAYWWWLNGNVTKDAITRDLEQMKAKGMAGGVIFDAGGATQGGHKAVPAGPVFASPEWRELFKHTVKEADRLGLTLSLSIQSGWNLGGPNVKPEDSAKRYSWSETQVKGPAKLDQVIAEPKQKNSGYYRDIAVVAYRLEGAAKQQAESNFSGITASSSQSSSSPDAAMDGNAETCWVSNGTAPGDGPTAKRPQWLQLSYKNPVAASSLSVLGRTGYGPRECELQASDDGKTFRKIKPFSMENSKQAKVAFEETKAACFRLVILDSYDPKEPKTPRNVQVAEFSLGGKEPIPSSRSGGRKPIQRFDEKTLSREIGGSAPDCSFLLDDFPGAPGEEDCRSKDVVDLTDRMDASGRLKWDAPEGAWMILRFGYSPSGSKVSTSSPGWAGMAIDYLDSQALINYWKEVVAPLIEDAGPLAGKSLKYLHTDSWELGGVNWTPKLPEMFRKRRGYDMRSYLPALAGKIVDNRAITNRFLHDFRKTVGDCVADNHYKLFAELAAKHGMEIHPESGGPHGAPVDALKCLGRSGVPMMEFWALSPHRPTDATRFFVKQ